MASTGSTARTQSSPVDEHRWRGSVHDVVDAASTSDSLPIEALQAGLSRVVTLRADLEDELEAIGESTALVPDDEHDAEGSTVGYERARVSALLVFTHQEIENLMAALKRVTGETYGRCDRCGMNIGIERLVALPTATRCVSCAVRQGRGKLPGTRDGARTYKLIEPSATRTQTPSHRPTGASPTR